MMQIVQEYILSWTNKAFSCSYKFVSTGFVLPEGISCFNNFSTQFTGKPRMILQMSCFYMSCNIGFSYRPFITVNTMPYLVIGSKHHSFYLGGGGGGRIFVCFSTCLP